MNIHQTMTQPEALLDLPVMAPMPFSEFMEQALYAEAFGYYTRSNANVGNDFLTAPLISTLFGRIVFNAIEHNQILEFGAGTAALAGQIITAWADHLQSTADCTDPEKIEHDATSMHYFILEKSPYLKQQQQAHLMPLVAQLNAQLASNLPKSIQHYLRVEWVDDLATFDFQSPAGNAFTGCIIGNEVLDALSVNRWLFDQATQTWLAEYAMPNLNTKNIINTNDNDSDLASNTLQLLWQWQAIAVAQNTLPTEIAQIDTNAFNTDYRTESHESCIEFLQQLATQTAAKQMIWIDYGYLREQYYHPQRIDGTLMCYHAHRAHGNPFVEIGKQDISAHVNFSLVMDALQPYGFSIDYFANQAQFLMDFGILEALQTAQNKADFGTKAHIQLTQGVMKLLSEAEMGEIIKVLCLNLTTEKF